MFAIKKRRICLIFLVILLTGCATSTINTDPYALRAMVGVDENSINDQKIYEDDMQFCSFEAAYNDVSNKGNLAAGSIGAAAGAAIATPAYLLAAPIAILAGGVAYFLGKGAEKGVEGNRRVQMMVNCLENKGYMVSLTGDYLFMEEVNKAEKIPWGVNEEQYRNKKSEDNSLRLEFVRKIEINEASIEEDSGTP